MRRESAPVWQRVLQMPKERSLREDVPFGGKAKSSIKQRVRGITAESNDDFVIEAVYGVDSNGGKDTEALAVVNILDCSVRVKLDTGAEVNVMPERVYQQLVANEDVSKNAQLRETAVKLTGYGGAQIPVKGTCMLPCSYKTQQIVSEFFIVETNNRTVLSLETCKQLNLIRVMHSVTSDNLVSGCSTEQIKENYSKVFQSLGKLEESYRMQLDPKAVPVAQVPRKIPAMLRCKLKQELDRMEEEQVIANVDEPTDWVHNPVIVEKPNGKLRVCLDPRELNKYLKREQYQLPTLEEIASRLHGARFFSTLDANQGYWQIPLDEKSSRLTTFNTPFGRYRFLRMPFGIHSAQEVFHKRVNRLYEELEGVETDIDDILVWGKTIEEHDQRLQAALDRTKSIGMTLNPDKCKFRVTEVAYLGHKLTEEGVRPDQTKIEAIINMPAPQDKFGVQRLLGMVNNLTKFIPEMSEITSQLRELLKKNVL